MTEGRKWPGCGRGKTVEAATLRLRKEPGCGPVNFLPKIMNHFIEYEINYTITCGKAQWNEVTMLTLPRKERQRYRDRQIAQEKYFSFFFLGTAKKNIFSGRRPENFSLGLTANCASYCWLLGRELWHFPLVLGRKLPTAESSDKGSHWPLMEFVPALIFGEFLFTFVVLVVLG